MSFKVNLISWLLLSYPIMDTLAFSSKGTMVCFEKQFSNTFQTLISIVQQTLDEQENFIERPKFVRKKIIKKSYDSLTPPALNHHDTAIPDYNEPLPEYTPSNLFKPKAPTNSTSMTKPKGQRFLIFPGAQPTIFSAEFKLITPLPFCQVPNSPCAGETLRVKSVKIKHDNCIGSTWDIKINI